MATPAAIRAIVDREVLARRLRELVSTPSENPPGRETEAGLLVQRLCSELGLEVSILEADPGRPNVIARWEAGRGRRLVYCTHLDVVPAGDRSLWAIDPYAAELRDGRVYGRGACDAKGCLVAALEAVRALKAMDVSLAGTLELMFVSDEETMGFRGAGHLKERGMLAADAAVVGEPTSLRVVVAQRGASWLRITTRGLAAHGSAPERGVNAISHMAEIVRRLEETMPRISHPVLGGPSLNVGTIRGGEKVNIVPASCVVEVDRRSLPGETERDIIAQVSAAIERARERFPDLDAVVEVAHAGKPFEVARDAPIVTEIGRAVADVSGAPPEVMGFRGASDARFFAEAGAETVLCGPGDITLAHTARESIDLEEVERAAVVYALTFARFLSAPP